jgi:multidrug resistance efflux pump
VFFGRFYSRPFETSCVKPAAFVLIMLFETAYMQISENRNAYAQAQQVRLFSEISCKS